MIYEVTKIFDVRMDISKTMFVPVSESTFGVPQFYCQTEDRRTFSFQTPGLSNDFTC